MNNQLLIHGFLGVGLLFFLIRTSKIYRQTKEKYYLIFSLILLLLLAGIIVTYFFPVTWDLLSKVSIRILILSIFFIVFGVFVFFNDIKRFFLKRKK
jgi:cytochrome c oxidase subunit IV